MKDEPPRVEHLEAFRGFLATLGEDATALVACLNGDLPPHVLPPHVLPPHVLPPHVRRYVAAALNYLIKSIDLVPDAIEDLGYLDDCFVLRVAARFAIGDGGDGEPGVLEKLSAEADVVSAFLGDDFVRLSEYVRSLREGTVRGRSVDILLEDEDARFALARDVSAWAANYRAPALSEDGLVLLKLRTFLNARLP